MDDTKDNLNRALLRAHKKIMSPQKNSDNPFFKSRYADLEGVIEVIRPYLLAEGIILEQEIVSEAASKQCLLKTIITHAESGEVKTFGPAVVPAIDYNDPQKVKSGITYMRRTQLLAIFALAEVDDDGNEASRLSNQKPAPKATRDEGHGNTPDPSKITLDIATKELYACKTKAQATIACNRLKKLLPADDADKLNIILSEVHEKLTNARKPGEEG